MEAYLLDQLLVTCSKYVVHIAIRDDGATGSGFPSDPLNAFGSQTDSDPRFDQIMRSLPPGTSIKLEPGTYYTNGFNTDYNPASKGWRPKSGMRLEGSGPFSTTLKLTNSAKAGELTSAIGCDYQNKDHFLDGFEALNFSIDGNYSAQGANSSTGGVAISGRHVTVRNLRVFNFGAKGSGWKAYGISLARAYRNPGVLTLRPTNCVIDGCRVDDPGGTSTNGTVGLHFAGSANTAGVPHDSCVIRDCLIDFGDTNQDLNYIGIVATGGRGTIVERNFGTLMKVAMGFETGKTWDMVFRRNQFLLVRYGVEMAAGNNDFLGQLVMLHNRFDLAGTTTPVKGIYIKGSSQGLTPGPIVLRRNLIRRSNPATELDGDRGIELDTCTSAIVERNVIDVKLPDQNTIYATSCANLKTFANRKTDSTLRPAWDVTNSRHSQEWELESENMLML